MPEARTCSSGAAPAGRRKRHCCLLAPRAETTSASSRSRATEPARSSAAVATTCRARPTAEVHAVLRTGTSWVEETTLVAFDAATGDALGGAVALSFDGVVAR